MLQIIDTKKRLFDPTGTSELRKSFRFTANQHVAQFREKLRSVVQDQRSLSPLTYSDLRTFDRGGMLRSFNQFSYYFAYTDIALPNWYNKYLKSSYLSGQRAAWELMGNPAPIGFDVPDTSAYSAFQNELEGITDATLQHIGRVAHDVLEKQISPISAFRRINVVLDKILIRRLDMLVHGAVVKLHNHGRIEEFYNAGHRKFGFHVECVPPLKHMDAKRRKRLKASSIVEFVTAGDDDVCPVCEDLEGRVFTYTEAIGLIPVHPYCRCAVVPA